MAFLSGFVAVFLLWGCLALVMDSVNNHLLSKKIAMIFLKDDQYGYLILITAFIGGLTGGLSSLTGSLAKAIIKKP